MAFLWVIVAAVAGVILLSATAGLYAIVRIKKLEQRLRALEETLSRLRARKTAPAAQAAAPPPPRPVETPLPETAPAPSSMAPAPTIPTPAPSTAPRPVPPVSSPRPQSGPPPVEAKVQSALDAVKAFFTGGSLVVKAGVVVLFFGVSFMLKYAVDHAMFPLEMRFIAAALGGLAMLAVGWRLRATRESYALVMQGGGVAIMYLTTFAALRLYALIPAGLAFGILAALSVLSAMLAVLQDSPTFAVLGVSGGFLAPVLASTGGGNHVMLFSYYAVLNASIIAIAWHRAWRALNLVGFAFTFGIGASWGQRYFTPEKFSTTEPFLVLFFLMYVAVAVLFATRQPVKLKGYVDGTIVFGAPVISFALQALLMKPYRYGLAWSALALGLFYVCLAWALYIKRPRVLRMLAEAFLAFGTVFGTLAIPLAFDGRWTSAAWAVEGAAILWTGIRQDRPLARFFGVLLQLSAGIAFLTEYSATTGALPVLNGYCMGMALISLTGLFASYYLARHRDVLAGWEKGYIVPLFVWGVLWCFSGGLHEIEAHADIPDRIPMALMFVATSCLAFDMAGRRLTWEKAKYPALGLLPAMIIVAITSPQQLAHPLAGLCLAAWPAAFAAHSYILFRRDDPESRYKDFLHAGGIWLFVVLAAWELGWQADGFVQGAGTWAAIPWGVVPAALALALTAMSRDTKWPYGKHYRAYLSLGAGPLAAVALAWTSFVNLVSRGDPWPLSYLPFLNPLDLAALFVFLALPFWRMRLAEETEHMDKQNARDAMLAVYSVCVFVWLNAVLVRTVHHWGGVPFSYRPMFASTVFQSALSIMWSVMGLVVMVAATRKGSRAAWTVGAALLGAVVVKLFMVDLSSTGAVARIVSFVGTGVLLLIVGYLSPLPPKAAKENER